MNPWKRALIFGSFGAGAILLVSGKRAAAAAMAGMGVAALATEYPDKFEQFWQNAPEYLNRGTDIMNSIARVGERLMEQQQGGRFMDMDDARGYGA
jgi:hypothetical protein